MSIQSERVHVVGIDQFDQFGGDLLKVFILQKLGQIGAMVDVASPCGSSIGIGPSTVRRPA